MMESKTVSANRRLVDLGQEIHFTVHEHAEAEFRIFPRYLESCNPNKARAHAGRLKWLDDLPSERFDLAFKNGVAEIAYRPPEPGNYMARLYTPERTVYCYFAAVTPEYLVYRVESYGADYDIFASAPEMRNGGIPIDWALNVDQLDSMLDPAKGNLAKLMDYQETFDDLMLPWFGTAYRVYRDPTFDMESYIDDALARLRTTGLQLDRAVVDWQVFQDAVDLYRERGFDVVDGVMAEAQQCMGAPWFPYWMKRGDFVTPAEAPTEQMAMIMDFCAGLPFHGPPSFHMIPSQCDWTVAAPYVERAAREHALIAKNSGSNGPVFVPTLLTFKGPAWTIQHDWSAEQILAFGREFIDDTAFVHARKYPVVFARCTDIADYLRDHPAPQPRRIYSSLTHDWPYDRWWSPEWGNNRWIDIHREVLPRHEKLRDIRDRRPYSWSQKPTSREMIYYEDARGKCRFEYACLKPLHWYDYSDDRPRGPYDMQPFMGDPPPRAAAPDGRKQRFIQRGRQEILVPDPNIEVAIRHNAQSWEVEYRITGGATFPGYRLAVWDIPREFAGCPFETNATEFIPVRNADNDFHGILVFDLEPEITLTLAFKSLSNRES
ncbi:MAG: hypothetical protein K9N49_08740 [Candidatus Marinimicrobia bacterium]|nr:hypothetical protein [Candidatus Neomarinimicrobiota bacterium]